MRGLLCLKHCEKRLWTFVYSLSRQLHYTGKYNYLKKKVISSQDPLSWAYWLDWRFYWKISTVTAGEVAKNVGNDLSYLHVKVGVCRTNHVLWDLFHAIWANSASASISSQEVVRIRGFHPVRLFHSEVKPDQSWKLALLSARQSVMWSSSCPSMPIWHMLLLA